MFEQCNAMPEQMLRILRAFSIYYVIDSYNFALFMIGKKISKCGSRTNETKWNESNEECKKCCFFSLSINCKIYNLFCFSLLASFSFPIYIDLFEFLSRVMKVLCVFFSSLLFRCLRMRERSSLRHDHKMCLNSIASDKWINPKLKTKLW